MQAQGRLQCWNADGAGKGQATTLEQQRLTARGLGGSCREEAMQQLEDCKGGGRWRGSTPPVEGFRGFRGFRGFKRLKAGKRQSNALTRQGYVQAKGRLQCWNADGQELGGSCRAHLKPARKALHR